MVAPIASRYRPQNTRDERMTNFRFTTSKTRKCIVAGFTVAGVLAAGASAAGFLLAVALSNVAFAANMLGPEPTSLSAEPAHQNTGVLLDRSAVKCSADASPSLRSSANSPAPSARLLEAHRSVGCEPVSTKKNRMGGASALSGRLRTRTAAAQSLATRDPMLLFAAISLTILFCDWRE